MKKSRLMILSAFAMVAVCLTGCKKTGDDGGSTVEVPEFRDSDVYRAVLRDYNTLFNEAHSSTVNAERFVKFADAEAYLLDSAVLLPMTTEGGRYGLSRVLPYCGPYARYGSDSSKYKGYKIIKKDNNELLLTEYRDILKQNWQEAVERGFAEEGENSKEAFNAAEQELLESWGITEYYNTYTTIFSSMPETLDYLATSHAGDSDVTTNLVDGLFEHDRFGDIVPALGLTLEANEDKTVYTIQLRENVPWVQSNGEIYGYVTADDFLAGFQHLLDAKGGSEDIVNSIVVGASDYSNGRTKDFNDVGIKALDEHTIQLSFVREVPYIESLLTFSIFQPMNRNFFLSKGGAFGIDEFARVKMLAGYSYGTIDPTSILYCGAYRLTNLTASQGITYTKNTSYWDIENVTLDTINLVYTQDTDEMLYFEQVINGTYAGISLSTDTLALAREEYPEYIYKQDTAAGTFYGAFNLNRRTYSLSRGQVASPKDDTAKALTKYAVLNKNFRKAFLHAIDKASWNANTNGEELRENNLRNMLGDPNFVNLPEAYGGYDAHTPYGEIVQDKLNQILAVSNEEHAWTDGEGNPLNETINVSDGVDGWFDQDIAYEYYKLAKEELLTQHAEEFGGREAMEAAFPIQIDIVYLKNSPDQIGIQILKAAVEQTFGRSQVTINAVEAPNQTSYLASTYLAATGAEANYDFYYGSGWIPDYGDPATFLETMVPGGSGYMTKVIGLW